MKMELYNYILRDLLFFCDKKDFNCCKCKFSRHSNIIGERCNIANLRRKLVILLVENGESYKISDIHKITKEESDYVYSVLRSFNDRIINDVLDEKP